MAAITCKSLAERMDAFESRLAALETRASAPAPKAVVAPKAAAVAPAKITPVFDTTPSALKGGYRKGDMVVVPATSVRCVNGNVVVADVYKGIVTGTGHTAAKNMSKAPEGSQGFTDAITISGSGKTAAVVYIWAGTGAVKVIGRAIAPVATVA